MVRKDLEPWQVLNTVGHISAYLGNQLQDRFGTGNTFVTKDDAVYPRNSQYPIVIKRASSTEQLRNVLTKTREQNLLHLALIREMIDHTDDTELQKALAGKDDGDVELLGIGIFGPNDEVASLTKKFGLWS